MKFINFATMAASSFQTIKSKIEKRDIAPLYFFYGEESYFIDELARIAEQHILNPGEEAFNKTVFYGRDADSGSILDQARRFPMMAERQLIILREAHALKGFDVLKPIIEKPVPSTVLVILYKKDKVDKRYKVFKELMKNAVVFESKRLYENQVPVWLKEQLSSKKMKLSARSCQLLIEYLGMELEKLSNALNKLEVLSKDGEVTDKEVEDTIGISRNFNVFELQESIGSRDSARVLHISSLMEKDQKNNPIQLIIPSLFGYISKLYAIKPLGNNLNAIKPVIRIRSDFIVKKYISAAGKYSFQELEFLIHLLKDYDLKSKGVGVRSMSQENLFKELMLRVVTLN